VLRCQQWYALQQDDTPPALLYLAVRAARRAVAVNPEDAQAYLVLGKSYRLLLRATRERAWTGRVSELMHLRRAQASAALNRAVALAPELAQAHLGLAELYSEMNYLDLALHHLRQYQNVAGAAAALDEKAVSRLAEDVAGREAAYAAEAGKSRVFDRAKLAYEKGLAGKARDLLLESDVAAFGAEGMVLELDLLLRTGQPRKVREWTSPEQKAALRPMPYHWVRAQALAASGDYALAEEECERLAAEGRGGGTAAQLREAMAAWVGEAALDEQSVGASWPDLIRRALGRTLLHDRIARLGTRLGDEANANTMRGLLLLEEGNVDEAEVAFRLALALWQDEAAAASGAGLDFKARPIAQGCLPWLTSDDKVTR
jgi:tetratricopeptide (TPR) repeat protein